MPSATDPSQPSLLQRLRTEIRYRHYSIRTEQETLRNPTRIGPTKGTIRPKKPNEINNGQQPKSRPKSHRSWKRE